eukprot:CAMPEP_0171084890 /NCGR_PEP_ID=MMETSP0766_2-20121228/18596_1 /TAXON_ID=439317 /ORGANISM="Gambierdiscus australes, Strain CAWD 149" /LENGTH=44 /DNA_ID= /DNA_START= /DNA_END= /DNA_ORIENTATION=
MKPRGGMEFEKSLSEARKGESVGSMPLPVQRTGRPVHPHFKPLF